MKVTLLYHIISTLRKNHVCYHISMIKEDIIVKNVRTFKGEIYLMEKKIKSIIQQFYRASNEEAEEL